MNENYIDITKYIDESKVRFNEPMEKHTTIKIGGKADVLCLPENIEDVISVLKYAKEMNVPVTVIGNGSKLLVKDGGIRGLVIKLGSKFKDYNIEENTICVSAGMPLPLLAIIAKDNSLSGLEFAAGIPGNVGGAVFMNAGAYGSDMAAVVSEVTFVDDNLNVRKINGADCNFGYRTSIFRKNKNWIVLYAKLSLKKGIKEDIEKLMKENNKARKDKQPLEYPNAGSTFKRPEGFFVGKIIDDLGLKGYTIGGAQISTKHSGFIVNINHAKAKDVLQLIEHVKEKTFEKFNVMLEEEIIILGEGE